MVTAGDICVRDVVVCDPNASLIEAARKMRDRHVGSVVVVEDAQGIRRPVGVLTDCDIVIGPVAARTSDLGVVRAADVMTAHPVTAREDEGLDHVLRKMRSSGLRRVPIVDAAGALRGMLAFDDFIEFMSEEMAEFGG